jgi:hypothetical protein
VAQEIMPASMRMTQFGRRMIMAFFRIFAPSAVTPIFDSKKFRHGA